MKYDIVALGFMIAGLASPDIGQAQTGQAPATRGVMANETYVEVEAAAARGAVALWALGAIEEHGPHLPLSTDVDISSAQLAGAAQALAEAGIETHIVPAYGWGVNKVTEAFAGSISIRAEVMVEIMLDVFRSLRAAGFEDVYCITGHFDAAHAGAIAEAVRRAQVEGIIRARFVVPDPLALRLGLSEARPGVVIAEWPAPGAGFPDLHAGEAETSAMMYLAPGRVHAGLAAELPATNLSAEEVGRWREGGATARRITPRGYLGAPAGASAEQGRVQIEQTSGFYGAAIRKNLREAGRSR